MRKDTKKDFKLKIYLAGWHKDYDYRAYCKDEYGDKIIFIDPMENISFDKLYKEIGKDLSDIYLIRRDKKLIEECDILVAKVEKLPPWEFSCGTFMEIMYAYEKGVPVFLISSDENIIENPWMKFHSEALFYDEKECMDFIVDKEE